MSSNVQQQCQLLGPVEAPASTPAEGTKKKRGPRLKYRPDGVCELPGCGKAVPAGMVNRLIVRYFCSKFCQRKEYYSSRFVIDGVCEQCGGPKKAGPSRKMVGTGTSRSL